MKTTSLNSLKHITTLAIALTGIFSISSVKAADFQETNVDQNQVVAVARPYGDNKYDLLVIQQIPGKRQCWSESGSNPVVVDPLLLNYDFTGICNRATDSNGYSIRVAGKDYGLDYILRLVKRDGQLLLVATNRSNTNQEIIVGTTKGLASGLLKIQLEPGWKFTKRTYKGKTLGHFYFSADSTAVLNPSNTPTTSPSPSTGSTTASFKDINQDIYKKEIGEAVALGFISGFREDNTFRPEVPLTREQLVSMIIEAMKTIPEVKITLPEQTPKDFFSDVDPSRWSATKIAWAQQNKIVTGYPDNSFQPTKPVTRTELMAVLSRAAEYVKTQKGLPSQLTANKKPVQFADVPDNFWGKKIIEQMSSYCGVASPLNETGDNFDPQGPALRNYAAAATLRMRNCVIADKK